jgi:hypothetical protein
MYRNARLAALGAALAACAQPGLAAPIQAAPKIPAAATLKLPDLNVPLSDEDRQGGDKYFYFHRADTSYVQALADIRECDDLARGVKSLQNWASAPYPYAGTLAGVGGELIGNAMVALIFGSAEERKMRRANMRRCMNYKSYDRYALPKDTWQQFNFEEALKTIPEDERITMLAQQAKAASGPKPSSGALGK